MPELDLPADGGGLGIASVMKLAGLVGSTSEAFRMIQQGAVRVDGERIEDRGMLLAAGRSCVIQVGKRRVARVTIS